MKILFLNPPFLPRFSRSQRSPAVTKSGTLYYPMWLAYAAGLAEKAGHDVRLVDACANGLTGQQTAACVKDFSPGLVIIDTSTPSIYNDVAVADTIKQSLPCAFIALVGAHVSALPEETLALSGSPDAVLRGEYDLTVIELAQRISDNDRALTGILGITFRDGDTITHTPERPVYDQLDSLPFVSAVYKKHLHIANYFFAASLYPEVQILTSRGCPFRCFFCLWPQTFQGQAYRSRSPQNVVDEMRYIQQELPEVKGVVIEDDTFTVNKKRVEEICTLLIQRKVTVPWNANVRTDLDLSTMRLMKRAGCYLIIVGIESTTQAILDGIDKDERADDIQGFFDNAKRSGLLVHAAFMAGNPGETITTLEDNLRSAKKYLPDTVQFFPLMPYPGTKAYAWAQKNKYLKINTYRDYLDLKGLHNCIIDLPGLPAEALLAWCNSSRRSFYLSMRYLWYKLLRVACRPQEAVRTYRAFRTFRKHILKKT